MVPPRRKPLTLRSSRGNAAALSVAFSPEGRMVCVGHADGTVAAFDVGSGLSRFEFSATDRTKGGATTAVAFRPTAPPALLTATCGGRWERRDLRTMDITGRGVEGDNEIYAIDYRPDGGAFATAGLDAKVRLYDEATEMVVGEFAILQHHAPPSAARIQAVKFLPSDPFVAVVGGWSSALHRVDFRDRVCRVVAFGPFLAGPALDVAGTSVLCATYRIEKRIRLYDVNGWKEKEIPWRASMEFLPVCAALSKGGESFAVGGGAAQGTTNGFVVGATDGRGSEGNGLLGEWTTEGCVNDVALAAGSKVDPPRVAAVTGSGQLVVVDLK